MSMGIHPVFQPKLNGTRIGALGEFLAANLEALDEIARSANLTPVMAFADNRPVPDDFDGDPDELGEIMGEWTEWFDPSEGQDAARALADQIKANPEAANQLEDAGEVVEELEELVRLLAAAAAQRVRFRLEMS